MWIFWICCYYNCTLVSVWSWMTASCLRPLCRALRRRAWFMSRIGTAEMSTGASCSCISSKSLHVVLGTDCLFVTRPVVSKAEGKRKAVPSQPFPCRILVFLHFLSDRQSLSGRHTEHLNAGVVGNLSRSLRIGVQSKKKKKKKEKVVVALNKSLSVWQIKNIPVKRTCLPGFSWFILNHSGLHCCPCQSSGALPGAQVSATHLQLPLTHFTFLFMAAGSFLIEWTPITMNRGELPAQFISNGRWLHGILWGFLISAKKKITKTTNYTNWIRQDADEEEEEEEEWQMMFSFLNKMMNYKKMSDLFIHSPTAVPIPATLKSICRADCMITHYSPCRGLTDAP